MRRVTPGLAALSLGVCGRIDESPRHWVREFGRAHLPLGPMGKMTWEVVSTRFLLEICQASWLYRHLGEVASGLR